MLLYMKRKMAVNRLLEALKQADQKTVTENGAPTYRNTGSECLNLFVSIGAMRVLPDEEIRGRFVRAFTEDRDLAMKILFYARDIRGGLGERRVFRTIMTWLAFNEKPTLVRNLPYVAEFGRWDDVLALLDTPARAETEALLKAQLVRDLEALEKDEPVSLLAKWLPSVNASNARSVSLAKQLARAFGLRDAEYRKALSALRARIRIIENSLRERDYTFDYEKQPAKAMFKYRRAFVRNDNERYVRYIRKVQSGKATMHTGTLMPYEIVRAAKNPAAGDRAALDATWNALEDFTGDENALVVADGSGSMYWGGNPAPAEVAQSLAIYFAERNKGAFRDYFITFSMTPRLVEIKGRDIAEKVRYVETFNECANTNLSAVFDLILDTAVRARLPQAELPSTLYIITDMEFDQCAANASLTNFEYAKQRFERYGYRLPRVVFWNVQSRQENVPVRQNEQGVALVSGCTARIFSQVMKGEMDPYQNMLNTVCTDRYAAIRAA